MQTDNLNDIIRQNAEPHKEWIDPDYVTLDTEDYGNDDSQFSCQPSIPDNPIGDFQPDSEEALLAYTARIHAHVQTNSITGYWEIGRCINQFYKGKYGTKELDTIAQGTGIGRDTLAKACKFARQYSKENVEVLLRGRFVVSWRHISQNLAVPPHRVIEVYNQAPSREQFYNGIIKLKDPSEARGKTRRSTEKESSTVKEPAINASSELGGVFQEIATDGMSPELTSPIKATEAIPVPKDDKTAEETIKGLLEKNERLRKELENAMHEFNELKILFHDAAQDITRKSDLIDRLRDALSQVYQMVENGCNHEDILAEVEWGL